MGESLPLPELVSCEPYRARMSAADCAARYRKAHHPDLRSLSPRIDLEFCLSCDVGRERAEGPPAAEPAPKKTERKPMKMKTKKVEEQAAAVEEQAPVVEIAPPVEEQAPEAEQLEKAPTCRFFGCAAPVRRDLSGVRWTNYCSEHGSQPNPGLRSRAAEREWNQQQLEASTPSLSPAAPAPAPEPEAPAPAPAPACSCDRLRSDLEDTNREMLRLLQENVELRERLADANSTVTMLRCQLQPEPLCLEGERLDLVVEQDPAALPSSELFKIAGYALDRARELLGRVG